MQVIESADSRSKVKEWLNQLDKVQQMDPPEVARELEIVDKSAGVDQLFYFGALNQRLQDYGAWTVARDAFHMIQESPAVHTQQRQLAGVLRLYNQSRINGYLRYGTLQKDQTALRESLVSCEHEKRELEQKIKTLTELETTISTRQED